VGWPGAHRVLPNGATERWLRGDPRGPAWVRRFNRVTRAVMSHGPDGVQAWMAEHQRVGVPLLSPVPPSASMSDHVLDTAPLYAGRTVERIHDLRPAASIVRDLATGLPTR